MRSKLLKSLPGPAPPAPYVLTIIVYVRRFWSRSSRAVFLSLADAERLRGREGHVNVRLLGEGATPPM